MMTPAAPTHEPICRRRRMRLPLVRSEASDADLGGVLTTGSAASCNVAIARVNELVLRRDVVVLFSALIIAWSDTSTTTTRMFGQRWWSNVVAMVVCS